MSTLKSFWFWFAAAWFLLGAVASAVVALKFPPWTWMHTAGAAAWFLLGIATSILVRQRSLISALSKGAQSRSSDKLEESWKAGFSADVSRILEGLNPVAGGGRSPAAASKLVWVVSADFDASRKLLESGGATDATASRSHELSGELASCCHLLSRKEDMFVLLKELPDPRAPSTLARAGFLLELLAQKGRRRPVDAVLALSPLQKEVIPQAIQIAIQFLADTSGVEFPIHMGLHGAQTLAGGEGFFPLCPEPPGATLPWTRQEDLPKAFDLAWARMESDLDAKEGALLSAAWKGSADPTAVFQFMDSLRRLREPVKAASLSCASQFSGGPTPFLRGFYLLPSPQLKGPAETTEKLSSPPDAMFFGSALFEDDASKSGATEPVASPSRASLAALEFFLDHLQAEAPLARLGRRRQIRASAFSMTVFVACMLASALVAWAAIQGWMVGAGLERTWRSRLAQDRTALATWSDASSMRSNLAALDDIDRLVDDIDHGRPWLLAPGFYRRNGTLPEAESVRDTLVRRLVRQAFSFQEDRLRSRLRGADSLDARNLYGDLKVYLLLTRRGWAEGSSKEGTKGLAEAYVHAWSGYLGYGDALPPFERSVLPRVAGHVAEKVGDGDSSWLGPQDASLVVLARGQLRDAKNQSGTYGQILAAADTLPKLDWDSLGLPQKEISCRPVEIPAAFTRRGWFEAIQPALKRMGDGDADWVKGPGQSIAASTTDAEVVTELERRYAEDFVAAWKKVMDTATCRLPSDNQRLGTALATLSSPYSRQNPKGILAFFQRILDETNLEPPKDTGRSILPAKAAAAVQKASQAASAAERMMGRHQPVDAQVAQGLASVRGLASDAAKGALESYLKDLAQLSALFNQWSTGDGALAFAKGVTSQDARNPLVHAWNEAASRRETLPADLRPWFQAFTWGELRQIASCAFPQARIQASASYREKVLQPWRNLSKSAFPFDPYAENEASIADIDALLNPKSGTLAAFLRDMDGLILSRDNDIKAVSANGMGMSLDPQAVEQLRKLLRISEFFYGRGGSSWKGVNASISVRADTRAHVILRVGTQTLDAPPGTERKLSMRWPQPGQEGVSLQASTVNRTFEEKRDGQWALLRLVESRSPGSSEATWSFNDRSYIVDVPLSVRIDQPDGPFQDREFLHVALLQDLFL